MDITIVWEEIEIGTDGWIVRGAAVLVALCVFFLWLRRPLLAVRSRRPTAPRKKLRAKKRQE